jgi:type I restriction enzyme S subunit
MSSRLDPRWPEVRLGDHARIKARLGWKGLKANEYVLDGPIFLAAPNLRGGRIDFEHVDHLPQWRYEESPEIQLAVGDVLLVKDGSTLGMSGIVKNLPAPTTVNGSIAVIRPHASLASGFLFYSINGQRFQRLIWLRRAGLGVPHLFQADLREFKVSLPSVAEQNSVDEILSTLDETIEQTEMLIAKYQQMKAGLMQDLFTRGVTPDGRLRPTCAQALHLYKESPLGWIPREWDVQPLSELAQIDRGKFSVRPRNDPRYYDGPYPFIQTGDVALSGGRLLFASCQSLNAKGLAVSRLFERGTIMVTIAANIADTCTLGVPMCAPDSLVGIKPYRDELTQFIELCIRRRKHWFESRAPQTAQKNINLSDLRPMLVPVPTEREIGHIVQAFDSLERSTEANESQLNKLRQLKLGLMHDLLTGRVRVKASESEGVPA